MMGTSHAATGVLAGGAVAVLCGTDVLAALMCATVGAGAALLPDLDEPGSSAGRSLGRVTELASTGLRELSRRVYLRTATARELAAPKDGGHRYLTHTVPACLVFALVALGVALVPAGAALVVFAMSALGLGTVIRSWRSWGTARRRRRVALGTAAVFGACTLLVQGYGPAPWLIGLVVFAGTLTHVLGDWLTRSGVPLAWPFTVRGKRWWMLRSPVAFQTGRSRVEVGIRVGALIGFPVVLALGAPLPPVA
ncbi:metal-dependent hydrolase [Nocardiopsis sp. NPDC058631]|uniref:metal-dependent hydrolase n=1 Tax=Nocardiopsis sp. NPDC058631 TaxID=3346566 RepID=UPI00365DBE7F